MIIGWKKLRLGLKYRLKQTQGRYGILPFVAEYVSERD